MDVVRQETGSPTREGQGKEFSPLGDISNTRNAAVAVFINIVSHKVGIIEKVLFLIRVD
jgi:hypothetical protein